MIYTIYAERDDITFRKKKITLWKLLVFTSILQTIRRQKRTTVI